MRRKEILIQQLGLYRNKLKETYRYSEEYRGVIKVLERELKEIEEGKQKELF